MNCAKKGLRGRSGHSPRQLVFGAQLRTSGDLFEEEGEEENLTWAPYITWPPTRPLEDGVRVGSPSGTPGIPLSLKFLSKILYLYRETALAWTLLWHWPGRPKR